MLNVPSEVNFEIEAEIAKLIRRCAELRSESARLSAEAANLERQITEMNALDPPSDIQCDQNEKATDVPG